MKEIDDDAYLRTLKHLVEKKQSETKDKNPLVKNAKVARCIASKGFEQDLIWDVIKEITTD